MFASYSSFLFPDHSVEVWLKPITEAGFTTKLLDVEKHTNADGQITLCRGACITWRDMEVYIVPDRTEPVLAFAMLLGRPKYRPLRHNVSRILIASGATLVDLLPRDCEQILVYITPSENVEDVISLLRENEFVLDADRPSSKLQPKWIKSMSQDFFGTLKKNGLKMRVFSGAGFDAKNNLRVNYVAFDYRKPFWMPAVRATKIISSLHDCLEKSGAQKFHIQPDQER
jgi:hypothetical protein